MLSRVLLSLALLAGASARPFDLDEVVPSQFAQSGWNGTWISETEFTYTRDDEPGIFIFNMASLTGELFINQTVLDYLNTTAPTLSPDRQYLLASSDILTGFRYSSSARYSVYDLETGEISYVANHAHLQYCTFDGVGHGLAFVLDNDLYYRPPNSTLELRLTFDGVPGIIYNGVPDWVYEEEVLYSGAALWFSTDGSRLAVASFDDTLVDTYSYYRYGDPLDPEDVYPELIELKYPKVGRTNPAVRLRAVSLPEVVAGGGDAIAWLELPAPEELVTSEHVLGGVGWPSPTEVAAQWLNRRQNLSALHICDVIGGTCTTEFVTDEPLGWIGSGVPRFINSGAQTIDIGWSQAISGGTWRHLVIGWRGLGTLVPITEGRVTVTEMVGINEASLRFFYIATVEDAPWQRHLYFTGAGAGCLSCGVTLPAGGACTSASANAGLGDVRYIALTCASTNEPSITILIDALTGEQLYTWQDNESLRSRLLDYDLPQTFISTVDLEGGFVAPVRFFLPPNFDETSSYPVIIYVYSGPNTITVQDTFTVGYHSYLTTSRDVIYLLMDGRGSGLKGQEMLFTLNNGLGSVEIEDHLIILRNLTSRYAWMDATRVGMWGSSYGGYATLLTMALDADDQIKCGMSSAPVTSWLFYDTIYTERYMGLPTEEDNLSGYEYGDVALRAESLRGKDFYIMHGNADDNVHFQNTMALSRALQELDILFEQMSYPDEAHALSGVTRHRYNAMDRYWERCLELN